MIPESDAPYLVSKGDNEALGMGLDGDKVHKPKATLRYPRISEETREVDEKGSGP